MEMKKVLLYSPYLHILGGGERHILSIMQVFDACGYQVDIVWDDSTILRSIRERLHIDFQKARVIPNFFSTSSVLGKLIKTRRYEYLFYVTDGSYFFSRSKNNYIFAMYPQKELYNMKFVNRLKLFNFSIISNGYFTSEYIDRWFGKNPAVIHPYIDNDFFNLPTTNKKNVILSVGRFYDHLHSKRQDVLIQAFQKLKKQHKEFVSFDLILAGGFSEADRSSLILLMKLAKKDPHIHFIINPTFNELLKLYGEASIFWHAAGYGIDERKEPYKVEHLGITPLEAMASGCVVFAHNSGGPKRLITEEKNGFLYNSDDDLVNKTKALLNQNQHLIQEHAREFVENEFSYKAFESNVRDFCKI